MNIYRLMVEIRNKKVIKNNDQFPVMHCAVGFDRLVPSLHSSSNLPIIICVVSIPCCSILLLLLTTSFLIANEITYT